VGAVGSFKPIVPSLNKFKKIRYRVVNRLYNHWIGNFRIHCSCLMFGVVTEFLFQADKATAVNSKIANPMIVQTINYSITWKRNSVTTPNCPPPPRIPQKRSDSFSLSTMCFLPSAVIIPMIVQTINYSITDLFEFIQGWHNWFKTASNKLTSTLFLNKGPDQTITVQTRNFWYGEETSESNVSLMYFSRIPDFFLQYEHAHPERNPSSSSKFQ
jgi:hypothetical protein